MPIDSARGHVLGFVVVTRLSTTLTDALAIDAPILQSGMGGVAGPDLVAAVSNARGLGILAALRLPPDQVRAGIRRVRELTDRPFGVNLWLHDDVVHEPPVADIPVDSIRSVQRVLNEFRPRHDLPSRLDSPPPSPDLVAAALEVMIEERIPVFSAAIGLPDHELVDRFHRVGSSVVAMVASGPDAAEVVDRGVDVVVAQGAEAGGHRSFGQKLERGMVEGTTVDALLIEVLDVVGARVPVAAAGGIVDGHDLAGVLVAGGAGVLLGTRFVATFESMASDLWKQRLLAAGPTTSTTITDAFTGQWARVLGTDFTERWTAADVRPLPGLLHATMGADLFAAAKRSGDDQLQPFYAGTAVERITALCGADEVVHSMVDVARSALSARRVGGTEVTDLR